VGFELDMSVATIYDREVFMLVLLTIYTTLTLTFITNIECVGFVMIESNLFGSLISPKGVTFEFFKVELSIFRKILVPIVL
jgi:hypothetical protein